MTKRSIRSAMSATVLMSIVWVAGCKVEKLPPREQQQAEKKSGSTNVVVLPTPTTDDAALVIASCGPAASDQVMTVNDKTNAGSLRRMMYNGGRREVALNFIPLQPNSTNSSNGQLTATSNTVWRFSEALVDNQRLLTAENIKVYLPCAASALAKEF